MQLGETVNSAGYTIGVPVERWGGKPLRCPLLPDNLEVASAAIGGAHADCDLIVFIGGASVGDRDVLRDALKSFGFAVLIERIAM